jgi:hypothetical protein
MRRVAFVFAETQNVMRAMAILGWEWPSIDVGTTMDREIKREIDLLGAEIDSLAAETLALSATLIHVLGRLIDSNPKLWIPISLGFDDAARYMEDHAIKLGKTSLSSTSTHHAVKALRTVEDLRTATIGNRTQPKDRV